MAVSLNRNSKLELCLVQFTGPIVLRELIDLVRYQCCKPDLAISDVLHIVEPDADFDAISPDDLDRLRFHIRDLLQSTEFRLVRRSAFICRSAAALNHITHWLRDRSARDGIHTDLRLCDTLEQAGQWLLLTPQEMADVAAGRGFAELARFDALRSATLGAAP